MSEYYNIYRKRVGYLGHDPQQKAFHSGILEFRKNLKYSENTEKGLRTRAGKRFDGIILTDKQDENRISQILCTDIEDKLQIGDMITWKNAQWLIYEETVSSYQPYNKYFIVRCDWVIKWVDQEGELHQEWCYLVG